MPLIIRFPSARAAGTVNDQLVSAIDFGPTCLNLAGLPAPAKMQGQAFLGPNAHRRDYIYAELAGFGSGNLLVSMRQSISHESGVATRPILLFGLLKLLALSVLTVQRESFTGELPGV